MDRSDQESKPELKMEASGGQVREDDPHLETEPDLNNTHAGPESLDPAHTGTDWDGQTESHKGSPVAVSSGHRVGSGSSASWRDEDETNTPAPQGENTPEMGAASNLNSGQTSRSKQTNNASMITSVLSNAEDKSQDQSSVTVGSSPGERKSPCTRLASSGPLEKEQSEDSAGSNHCTDGATSSSTGSLGHAEGPTSPPVTLQPRAGSLELRQDGAQAKKDTTWQGKSKSRKLKSKRRKQKAKQANAVPSDHPNSSPDQDERVSEKHPADSRQKKETSEQDENEVTTPSQTSKGRETHRSEKKTSEQDENEVTTPSQTSKGRETHRSKKKTSEQDANEATTPSQTSKGRETHRSKKSTDAGKAVHQQHNRTSQCTQLSKPDTETGDTTFSSAIPCTNQQVSQDTKDPQAHMSYLDQTKQVNESVEMKEANPAPKTEGRGSDPTETPTGTTSAGQQQSYNSSPHHRQVSKPNSPQGAMPPFASVSSSTQQFSQDSTCLSSSDQMNDPGDNHSPETKDKASGHMEKPTDAQSSDHQQTDSSSPQPQSSKPDSEAGAMTSSPAIILPEHQQSDPGQDSRASEMDQSNRNQKEDVTKEAQRKAETTMEETKRGRKHHPHEMAASFFSFTKEESHELSQQGDTSPAVVSNLQDQSMAPQNNPEQGLSVEDSGHRDTSVISASRFLMGTLPTTPPSDSTADGDTSVWAKGKEQRKDDDKDGNGPQTEGDEMGRNVPQTEGDEMGRNGPQTEGDEMGRNGPQAEGDDMARNRAQAEGDDGARNGAQTEGDDGARNRAQTEGDDGARNGAQTEGDDGARNGAQTEDDDVARNGAQTEGDSVTRDWSETAGDSMSSNGAPTVDSVDAGTGPQAKGDGVAGRTAESTLTGEDQPDSGNVNVHSNMESGGFPPLPKDKTSTPLPPGKNAPKMGAVGNLNNDQTSHSKRTSNASKKSTDAEKTPQQQPDRTSLETHVQGNTSPAVVSSSPDKSMAPQNNTEQGLSVVDSGLGDTFVISDNLFPMETQSTTPPSDSTRKPDSVQRTCDNQEDIIRTLQQEKQKLQGEVLSLKTQKDKQMSFAHNLQEENKKLRGKSDSVQRTCDDQEEIIRRLQQEKQKLQENLDYVGRAYSDQEDNIHYLQQENQQLQEDLDNMGKACSEQKDNIYGLQQENQQLQDELANMNKEYGEQTDKIQQLEQEKQQLQDSSGRLEAKVREQTTKLQHQLQQLQHLRVNSNRLEAQVKEQTSKFQLQQQELLDLREKSARLEKLSEDQAAALQRQQQEVNTLREEMASYDRTCNEQNFTINQLRNDKEMLHEKAAALETQYNQQLDRVQHLEPELQRFRDETSRLQAFETKCQEKDGHIRQLQQRIRQLEDEVATVRSQLVEKEKHLHGVIGLIANNTQEKEKAVAENQRHFNRLQEVLGEIKHFQDLAEESRKRELLFRTQVVFRTIINRTYRSYMENLEQQNRDMQGELNNCRRKCDAQQLNLTDALNQARENKTKLVNMEETHKQERRQLKGTISEMNDELERVHREVQHLTEDRDAARVECNRLTDAVEEMEAEKREWLAEKEQKEDQILQVEKERDELITNCKVLERRRQTAQEQSIKFGEETTKLTMGVSQLQTMYAEKDRQYQDAMSAHSNLERNLREQLRDKEQQVVPLEIEAKRATLELRNVRTQLENMEREKKNQEITVNALREELQQSNAAVLELQRTEERLRQEMAEQHTQKLRYIKEKQDCQRDNRSLLEEVNRLKMRRN